MTSAEAVKYQAIALHVGVILIGGVIFISALQQLWTGKTLGREGKPENGSSVVRRTEMPFYFWFLFCVRLVLGAAAVLCGLFLKW